MKSSPSIGIACDIGFENRLALENTRLLLTYATIDPARVRTLVLFCEHRSRAILHRDQKLSLASREYRAVLMLICDRNCPLKVKVWSKRRKINSPYRGTLSSCKSELIFPLPRDSNTLIKEKFTLTDGFTLMVIFFLVHVKNPPVLPNLQRIAPLRPMTKEEVTLEGRDVWFFDDTEMLRKEWSSANFESVGEL